MLDAVLSVPLFGLLVLILCRVFRPVRVGVFSAPEKAGWSPARAASGEVWSVFWLALGVRLLVLAATLFWLVVYGGSFSFHNLETAFLHWDAKHYVNLIEQGYSQYQEGGKHLFLVFFPAYVWLTRAVRLLVPNTVLAGVLTSSLCFAWGCCWVYKIGCLYMAPSLARDAVVYLALFPFSFFFGEVFTEGLFLLTTAAACYCALTRRWWGYAGWGAAAALTRMTGLLVLLPAGVALLELAREASRMPGGSIRNGAKALCKRLPAVLGPLAGMAGYWALNLYVDGDPFAFLGHQAHWYQGGMWVSRVLRYLWDNLVRTGTGTMTWTVWLPELVLFAVFLAVLAYAAWKDLAPSGLLLYGFFYLVVNYSLSWLLSAGRYLSCGFVFFLFAARLTQDRSGLKALFWAGEGVFLGLYLSAFLAGLPVM